MSLNGATTPKRIRIPCIEQRWGIGGWFRVFWGICRILFCYKSIMSIHLERVNGSYVFLYDLNIADYLSPQNPDSTAYFTVSFEGNVSDVHVYTAPSNSVASQWQPKSFHIHS